MSRALDRLARERQIAALRVGRDVGWSALVIVPVAFVVAYLCWTLLGAALRLGERAAAVGEEVNA